ncbi:MAG: 3'-5' exonuclease [Peptostreptococcaceae bacterium]|nr:3'-5' exonuclease [Peptostreptococcaceae bacterium]MBP3932025.1 3'-5' exonuclease [Peptostreptococcaceae bacterium]
MNLFKDGFLEEFVMEKIQYLNKDDLINLYSEEDRPKSSTLKDDLIKDVKVKFKPIDIYNKYKKWEFGLFPSDLEKILGIDKKIRTKMQKKGFIQVAYTREFRAYGRYLNTPFYYIEPLLKLTKEDVNKFITENIKSPTDKQLDAINKARETNIRNRTCSSCGFIESHKSMIINGICERCDKRKSTLQKFIDIWENKNDYVILDTETTGLGYSDKIVEIGVIDLDGNELVNTLVNPQMEIPMEASCIHYIWDSDVRDANLFEEIKENISSVLDGKKVLIYNSDFDTRMLSQSGYDKKINDICLMNMYMDYVGSERWISLADAMSYEEINNIQDHRAIGDCLCCLELIKKIVGVK